MEEDCGERERASVRERRSRERRWLTGKGEGVGALVGVGVGHRRGAEEREAQDVALAGVAV